MALRKIITEENELLYKISKPVEKFDDKLSMLIDDMFDTMHKAKGVGLAAPQIGILRRVVVIEINNIQYELVNPVITEQSGEQIAEEGCLSIPGFYAKTRRPARVTVEAYDRHGDKKT
ncbi:MAG: peptide deformylase, partial [Clostridia bacterium]|nr:peptide deformylase [Clostridia bacterium]